jgi:hypothetical protein
VPREVVAPDIHLARIAREQEPKDILKIMEVILGAAISCEDRKLYVDRLMSLEEAV